MKSFDDNSFSPAVAGDQLTFNILVSEIVSHVTKLNLIILNYCLIISFDVCSVCWNGFFLLLQKKALILDIGDFGV